MVIPHLAAQVRVMTGPPAWAAGGVPPRGVKAGSTTIAFGSSSASALSISGRVRRGCSGAVIAGTTRPVRIAFASLPDARTLRQSIDAVPADVWFADPNGTPDHRRHLTHHFAEEIRRELMAGDLP